MYVVYALQKYNFAIALPSHVIMACYRIIFNNLI